MMTPTFNDLSRFSFMGCVKEVSNLVNRPIVSLLDTRVDGTRIKVVYLHHKLRAASPQSLGSGRPWRWKECLSETSRPGFISTVSPDLPQPTDDLKEEDTIGDILFLKL